MILQNNPKAGYLAHKAEIDAAINSVLESGWYILGQKVIDFERDFAAFLGLKHAIGVANGTDAIQLALRALQIGQGDRVITVSHTAVASVAAIELAGATPILVDVDPVTYTIDLNQVEEVILSSQPRPRAIMPVHIYGQMSDMPALVALAKRHDMFIIEDCAQAHGATYQGKQAGTWGDVAAYSFYPTKNLGALGDGGMVATDNEQLASRLRMLREYGWEKRVSQIPGINSRLDELQAAILQVKLRYLQSENKRRGEIADSYNHELQGCSLVLPSCKPSTRHVYHQYVVRSSQRDQLRAWLQEKGIGTLIHYAQPVHLQPAYKGRVPVSRSLAVTEQIVGEIISLPMYPQLSNEDASLVTAALLEFHQTQG